jgi:hypothetical protein
MSSKHKKTSYSANNIIKKVKETMYRIVSKLTNIFQLMDSKVNIALLTWSIKVNKNVRFTETAMLQL